MHSDSDESLTPTSVADPPDSTSLPEVPPKSRRKGIVIAAIASLAFVALGGLALKAQVGNQPLGQEPSGSKPPNFTLRMMHEDREVSLSDYKGKPVVLNFWASWCGPCVDEAAILAQGWLRWKPKGVQFLGVNVRDSLKWGSKFEKDYGITYPSVLDSSSAVQRKYGVVGLPETFFIGRDGRIKAKYIGPIDAETLDRLVGSILNEL